MEIKLRLQQFRWMFRLARILFAGALLITSFKPSWAMAQSTDDPWTEPLNLSHSGIGLNPGFVIDSNGTGHVIWQDNLAHYIYTKFDGDTWSVPELTDLDRLFALPTSREAVSRTEVPMIYTGPDPLLVAGPDGYIYAFWLTQTGKLFTSRVRGQNFAHFKAWEAVGLISHDVGAMAVAVDARGEWQLAYIRTIEDRLAPAGLYYTRSRNNGLSWTVPELLYESAYLRKLGVGEANLSIATTGTASAPRIYVAWDNRPRKQVLLITSADGGENWEQPEVIAGAAPDSGINGPFNIQVGATQNSVVLVWQNGSTTNGLLPGCTQNYQSSSDAGDTWNDPQEMIQGLGGCALSNKFIPGVADNSEAPLYFLTETKGKILLTAWDGRQWGQSQEQPILSGFKEPEIYTDVIYACHQASVLDERLYVIGCDQGSGGDVWVTSRDVGPKSSLYKMPIWSQFSAVSNDNLNMEALEIAATGDGFIHAFFSQRDDPAIYYTYWNGDLWSHAILVLKLPDGKAGAPTIVTGPKNELFLVAPNSRGSLYLSRAMSGDATLASHWSTPTRMEVGHDGEIGSVDLAWTTSGIIYLTYSVPVNDDRGIYLVQSKDYGTTWSAPVQVFNGSAAGFDLVGSPSLLVSANGFLHFIWKQQSIQGDGVPQSLSLYYTRSEDGGHTFDDAERVVEKPVAWREIVADNDGNLHLLWQPQDSMTTLWDQISLDGGRSWQFPQSLPNEGTLSSVIVDSAGLLHLVNAGRGTLAYWQWDNNRWQSDLPLRWTYASKEDNPVELLGAAINNEGKMVVALAVPADQEDVDGNILLYAGRTVDSSSKPNVIPKAATPTHVSPTLIPSTPTPSSSAAPTNIAATQTANADASTDGTESNSRISPLTMALLPVALLLLSVLGFAIRRTNLFKD